MFRAAHLAELERRHRALESEIIEARAHPSIEKLQIAELKLRKLQVKDEIARTDSNRAQLIWSCRTEPSRGSLACGVVCRGRPYRAGSQLRSYALENFRASHPCHAAV